MAHHEITTEAIDGLRTKLHAFLYDYGELDDLDFAFLESNADVLRYAFEDFLPLVATDNPSTRVKKQMIMSDLGIDYKKQKKAIGTVHYATRPLPIYDNAVKKPKPNESNDTNEYDDTEEKANDSDELEETEEKNATEGTVAKRRSIIRGNLDSDIRTVSTHGRCRGMGPEIFHPTNIIGMEVAREHCKRCAVMASCGEIALLSGETLGVRGAMSEPAVKKVRKAFKISMRDESISAMPTDHPVRVLIRRAVMDIAGLNIYRDKGAPSAEDKRVAKEFDTVEAKYAATLDEIWAAAGSNQQA